MRNNEVLAAKRLPEQLWPPLISRGASGNRTRVSAVRSLVAIHRKQHLEALSLSETYRRIMQTEIIHHREHCLFITKLTQLH